MPGKIRIEETIPARGSTSLVLNRGETIRIIDVEGKQVADFVALSAVDKTERLSCAYSNVLNAKWLLTAGDILYTNRVRPMLAITADTVGVHYSGGGFCSEPLNYVRYGQHGIYSCADNLYSQLKKYGYSLEEIDLDACFNMFMNVAYKLDGSIELSEPLSGPGDYIDMRAKMECLIAISNCPQDQNPVNGFNPTPLRIEVFGSESAEI